MSNVRTASILFSLAVAGALLAWTWYQRHGGHTMLSTADAIVAATIVIALARFIAALIRCAAKGDCAARHSRIR